MVKAANKSYWTMAPGHNCTNYVAYRLIQDGMQTSRGYTTAVTGPARPASTTFRWTRRPRSDPLHSGTAEQVASVPRATSPTWTAVSADSITVAEDNYPAGPNQIRVITRNRSPDRLVVELHPLLRCTGSGGSGEPDCGPVAGLCYQLPTSVLTQ